MPDFPGVLFLEAFLGLLDHPVVFILGVLAAIGLVFVFVLRADRLTAEARADLDRAYLRAQQDLQRRQQDQRPVS